jgi:hypothetical protein
MAPTARPALLLCLAGVTLAIAAGTPAPSAAQRGRGRRSPTAEPAPPEPAPEPAGEDEVVAPWEGGEVQVSEPEPAPPSAPPRAASREARRFVSVDPDAQPSRFMVGLGIGFTAGGWGAHLPLTLTAGVFLEGGAVQHGVTLTGLAFVSSSRESRYFDERGLWDLGRTVQGLQSFEHWLVTVGYVTRFWLAPWCHLQGQVGVGARLSPFGALPSARLAFGASFIVFEGLAIVIDLEAELSLVGDEPGEREEGYDGDFARYTSPIEGAVFTIGPQVGLRYDF